MAQAWAEWFYKSIEWIKCRNAFMESKHYICERCGDIAKICHHKTYLTPQNIHDVNITLSWSNLEALCQDCHNKEHSSAGVCAEGLSFNSKGELIYTPRQNQSD